MARRLVLELKQRADRSLTGFMAETILDASRGDFDLVTWIPAGPSGLKRGFDQGELLARKVASLARVEARRLIYAREMRARQRSLTRGARFEAALASLAARPAYAARVLLIDDVVTTGASMIAGSLALREAGALSVFCSAFARTPRRIRTASRG